MSLREQRVVVVMARLLLVIAAALACSASAFQCGSVALQQSRVFSSSSAALTTAAGCVGERSTPPPLPTSTQAQHPSSSPLLLDAFRGRSARTEAIVMAVLKKRQSKMKTRQRKANVSRSARLKSNGRIISHRVLSAASVMSPACRVGEFELRCCR